MLVKQVIYVEGPKLGRINNSSDEQRILKILKAVVENLELEYASNILSNITPQYVIESGSMSFRLEILSSSELPNARSIAERCDQLMSTYVVLEQYVLTLVDLNKKHTSPSGSGYLSTAEQECRKIGEEINILSGFNGMQYVCSRISDEGGRVASRTLEYVWDGIGSWMG